MTVKKLLGSSKGKIISITPDTDVSVAASVLAKHKIGAVLVMQDGQLKGIFSERDIVRALAESQANCLSKTVDAYMTSKVIVADIDESVNNIMRLMTENRIRHIPVTEGDVICGIVSIGDVVKDRIADLESETEAMRNYIMMG